MSGVFNQDSPSQVDSSSDANKVTKFKAWSVVVLVIFLVAGAWVMASVFPAKPSVHEGANEVDVSSLEQAVQAGDQQAMLKLAHLYVSGSGVRKDLHQAASLYHQAMDKGNADAAAALGELYQSGRLETNGLRVAVDLYRKAADQGSVAGQYDLAYLYEQGLGVPHDSVQAAKYYLLAAQGGDSTAQYDIGQRYALGKGVDKDLTEAYKWLSLASLNGQKNADAKLKDIKDQMDGAQISEARKRVASFKPRTSS